VILLEDLGALLGLIFALFGVGMTLMTGSGYWDAVGTTMIGLLLVAIAVILAIETKSLLIGESATPAHIDAIEKAIADSETVERIIHMKTLHLGPDELLVAAKIAVKQGDSAEHIARGIDDAESRIRAAVPIARVIYLEPDLYRTAAAARE
jgi:divalent metal cation (Fe/Co/Zn/Cd) transporter